MLNLTDLGALFAAAGRTHVALDGLQRTGHAMPFQWYGADPLPGELLQGLATLTVTNPSSSGSAVQKIAFGDDGANALIGTDTYQFSGAFGKDTVLDSDGTGRIELCGAVLPGGKANSITTQNYQAGQLGLALPGMAQRDNSCHRWHQRIAPKKLAARAYFMGARGRFGWYLCPALGHAIAGDTLPANAANGYWMKVVA